MNNEMPLEVASFCLSVEMWNSYGMPYNAPHNLQQALAQRLIFHPGGYITHCITPPNGITDTPYII